MNVRPSAFAQVAGAHDLIRPVRSGAKALSALAEWLEQHPLIVLAAFSAVYFWFTVGLANRKLLWDDEFFTLYIAYAGYGGIWDALATGADQHPPAFYWITYALLDTFGYSPVVLRLPSIVGFWLLQLSLFAVVSRHRTDLLGYLAFLLPLTTSLYWYAYEARGYGLLLGFTGGAFFFWNLAVDGVRRKLTVPLFAACLALAICAHYYGILILMPFALGTLVYMLARRRLDFWLVLAHAAPLVPIAAFWGVIRAASGYSAHFWAKPQISAIDGTVYTVFTSTGGFLLLLLAALFAYDQLSRRRHVEWLEWPQDPAAGAKVAAVIAFALLPLAGYLLGALVTNAFNPRYAVTSSVGAVLVLVGALAAVAVRSKLLQLGLLAIILLGVAVKAPDYLQKEERDQREFNRWVELIRKYTDQGLPMALAEVTIFHKMAFYGPDDLRGKFFFLSDPESSVRWIGHDTIDRGLRDLAKWFHPGTVPYRDFKREHDSFFVYGYIGDWTWLTYQLLADRYTLTVLERDGQRLMLRADRPKS